MTFILHFYTVVCHRISGNSTATFIYFFFYNDRNGLTQDNLIGLLIGNDVQVWYGMYIIMDYTHAEPHLQTH